jgi:putative methyltransferase (TIGR04325 family)
MITRLLHSLRKGSPLRRPQQSSLSSEFSENKPDSQLRSVEPKSQQAAEPITFRGDFATWEEAERASTGYSAPEILEKTCAALLKVRGGLAAYERDSVTFDKLEYSYPLLAGLLRAAARRTRLSVLDFGGSLGSTYFQNRHFLSTINELRWSIVEQPAHVACGKSKFANEHLRFYGTIEECMQTERPDVLLLSGVIQCLPQPYGFLTEVLQWNFECIIVDRTPFMRNGTTRLTVESVPERIYKASYPSWFLSEERFLRCFSPRYDLLASFPALDRLNPEGGEADYKGFLFELKH